MKHLRTLLFLTISVFTLTFAGYSQTSGKASGTPSSDSSDSSTSSEFTENAAVSTNFDKTKNETTVEFKMMRVANTEPQKILLSASSKYDGQTLKNEPEQIIFIMSIASPGSYKYPDIMKLKIKADGKALPEVVILNLDKRKLSENEYLETIGTRMNYDVFKKIAQAKNVEMQVEDTKFQLTSGNIKRFTQLLESLQVN